MKQNFIKTKFPNGFSSWYETHHEIVSEMTLRLMDGNTTPVLLKEISETQGTGGLYELARALTDEFEQLNKGRQWDGEFFDEINLFCTTKFNNL